MRLILPSRLWIGNTRDLQNVAGTLALDIRAVVDLAASEAPIVYPRDILYLRLPLDDGPGNQSAILRLAIQSTAELIRAQIPTLVACSMGMSRSPAIATAALSIAQGTTLEVALQTVAASGASDVSPGLLANIRQAVSDLQ